ncbi:uncharacterized protein LOC122716001 isoform X2 [Apis laboriosa]|uniref:uncharacterized protein LOC122716001 isoform X2 n=1 Tax=Apis laboriosa TaxID=183418 RepID=UPI001CC5CF88|nr:uncharacterized protein LOC122716001 isoform X2 [Apis laboriosa]
MISSIVSRLVILVFGNLYPAYASYKAVRTKNVKEYVKWMMYWIVFALFTCAETFTDVFFSFWFPFYYEIKTILVIWLLSPATKGSSILYRRFVHPALIQREAEIDEALARATEQGYTAVLHLGSKGVNYATTVLMQTAIKGGGGLVQHLKKSYSLSDLTGEKEDENRNTPHMHDETDMEVEPRRREHVGRRGYSPRRTQSSSNRVEMYFSEVDVDVRQPRSREPTTSLTNIRSSDDISSGYSSGEALQSSRTSQGDSLVRTSSVGARTRAKPRSATKKTPEDSGEDSDSIDPPFSKNISFPPPLNLVTPEQALEILLLLSQNRNVADYIDFDRGPVVPGNDDLLKHTSQSGPEPVTKQSLETVDNPLDSVHIAAQLPTIPAVEARTVPERSLREANTDSSRIRRDEPSKRSTNEEENDDAIHPPITDQLCQNKFDELKQLLSDARKAVNNIVHTQEKLRLSGASIETLADKIEETSGEHEVAEETKMAAEDAAMENEASLDVWTTPSVSRSNSASLGRAGRYNKRPAPNVPLARSEEGEDGGGALRATLVIKTLRGKDAFTGDGSDARSKGKRSKRQRTREGFTKLLAIPRNVFQNAFHRAKSSSAEPREMIIELAPKSEGVRCTNESENDTSNSSDGSYVLAPTDDKWCKMESVETDEEGIEESVESGIIREEETSKIGKRLESDIF